MNFHYELTTLDLRTYTHLFSDYAPKISVAGIPKHSSQLWVISWFFSLVVVEEFALPLQTLGHT